MELPKISVIIPMYNAEKYIGDCLDSLLAQTFRQFEVIVVNDGSTDNSVEVVQSYIPKFGRRLRIAHMKKNSGSPGEPDNLGISLSRGEYLYILDSDDVLDADVLTFEKFFNVPEKFWHKLKSGMQVQLASYPAITPVSEPTLVPFDIAERVHACYERKFLWPMWAKLVRRDFLVENEIPFPDNIHHDVITTCCMAYSAEKFVLVPNVVYYYRVREGSMSRYTKDLEKYLQRYIYALTSSFGYFKKFLDGVEFFNKNPDLKNLALETLVGDVSNYLNGFYRNVPVYEFDEFLAQEFSKNPSTAMTVFFFNAMNFYRLELADNLQRIAELEKLLAKE